MPTVFPNPVPNPVAYLGVRATTPPNLVLAQAAPTAVNRKYPVGTLWLNTAAGALYVLANFSSGVPTWNLLEASGAAGVFTTLTVTGLSTLAAITQLGTANINATGAATTTIGAGTGQVNIGNTTGNTTVTGSLSTSTSLSATTSVSAGTTVTATLGNITATNGNLVLGTAGNKLSIATGSNASIGVTGNMSGTPGAISVASTAVTTSSIILFSRATTGGTPGQVSITSQTTGNFTLTSTGNETSTFNYLIIN